MWTKKEKKDNRQEMGGYLADKHRQRRKGRKRRGGRTSSGQT
jgi:hypothetical protein